MAGSLAIVTNAQTPVAMENRKNTGMRAGYGDVADKTRGEKARYAQNAGNETNNLDNLKKGEAQRDRKEKKLSELTAIEKYNNRSLSLDIDRDLNIVLAKIIDRKSGEVIKQIPPEQMVELMKYLKENPGTLLSRHL